MIFGRPEGIPLPEPEPSKLEEILSQYPQVYPAVNLALQQARIFFDSQGFHHQFHPFLHQGEDFNIPHRLYQAVRRFAALQCSMQHNPQNAPTLEESYQKSARIYYRDIHRAYPDPIDFIEDFYGVLAASNLWATLIALQGESAVHEIPQPTRFFNQLAQEATSFLTTNQLFPTLKEFGQSLNLTPHALFTLIPPDPYQKR